jgi:hypothetical protein
MKLENTKKSFIRTVKCGKNENHSNISIPAWLYKRLQLTSHDYTKIYVDDTNNLVFEKLYNIRSLNNYSIEKNLTTNDLFCLNFYFT